MMPLPLWNLAVSSFAPVFGSARRDTTDPIEIAGRIAALTAAGLSTGRTTSLALGAAGAKVVASDIDEQGGRETVAECGSRARFVHADLTLADDVRRVIEFAKPIILVNNVGGGGHITPQFPEATPAQCGATFDLNLRAPMLATQVALATMPRRGRHRRQHCLDRRIGLVALPVTRVWGLLRQGSSASQRRWAAPTVCA
jgi:NAD(P)-dependent dehydrogenase (short-subunit alcohol dehydrogenase family)